MEMNMNYNLQAYYIFFMNLKYETSIEVIPKP